MRHERQVQLLERIAASGPHQTGLFGDHSLVHAASVYTDAERFRVEFDTLFRRGPVLFGLTAELAGPGSYRTANLGGVPVFGGCVWSAQTFAVAGAVGGADADALAGLRSRFEGAGDVPAEGVAGDFPLAARTRH